MDMIQYIIIPFVIIVPALISYAILVQILKVGRIPLAIISGAIGGIIYGQLFASSMHLNNTLIAVTYFALLGGAMFFGLADLKKKRGLITLKSQNVGFLLAGLLMQYLIFFDIKAFGLTLSLSFLNFYWLYWIINLACILAIGFLGRITLNALCSKIRRL